jgi:hypothetical protein
MKPENRFLIFSFLIILISNSAYSQDFPVLKGPYLGQNPPGTKPEIFAPGIISFFIFRRYADGKSYAYEMVQKNGKWSSPELLPFSEKYQLGDFTIVPDGKTIIFQSNIPLKGLDAKGEGGNIYTVKKTGSGWTEPKHVGFTINSKWHDSYPCVAGNGTLYFFSRRPGGMGKADLYISRFENGKYLEPVNMGDNFNTPENDYDSFIAPDESYMIFCSTRPGVYGKDDIFVSFRLENGAWSKPVHMGDEINTSASENCPYITLDGKYFFFTSSRSGNRDIYWVDAKIIDNLKSNHLKN